MIWLHDQLAIYKNCVIVNILVYAKSKVSVAMLASISFTKGNCQNCSGSMEPLYCWRSDYGTALCVSI